MMPGHEDREDTCCGSWEVITDIAAMMPGHEDREDLSQLIAYVSTLTPQ